MSFIAPTAIERGSVSYAPAARNAQVPRGTAIEFGVNQQHRVAGKVDLAASFPQFYR
jgi:hypothetical protein